MTRSVLLTSALVCVVTGPAAAKQPGEEAYIIRMLACEGPDARMEVYIPQSIATNDAALARGLARSVIGYYTLDLTGPTKASCSNRSRSRSRPTSRRSSSTSIRASCRRRAFRSAAAPSISISASAPKPSAARSSRRTQTSRDEHLPTVDGGKIDMVAEATDAQPILVMTDAPAAPAPCDPISPDRLQPRRSLAEIRAIACRDLTPSAPRRTAR